MKRISLYLMSCTAILALVLTSCSANDTSTLDVPTATPVAKETGTAPTPTPVVQPTVSVPTIELVPYTSDVALIESISVWVTISSELFGMA